MNRPATEQAVAPLTAGVGHYENFPVASWLCPPALRPAVVALYRFARTADDLADEGDLASSDRLDRLARYRRALSRSLVGEPAVAADWPEVFVPLTAAVRRHGLPGSLLHDLISAFEQDVRHTAAGHVYADQAELLAYCRLSANPVGRLLLHLYGIGDERSLAQSDAGGLGTAPGGSGRAVHPRQDRRHRIPQLAAASDAGQGRPASPALARADHARPVNRRLRCRPAAG